MKHRPTINPFVSEAQRRACYVEHDPRWDCEEWSRKTKGRLSANSARVMAYDPSRTGSLRSALVAELRRRFADLERSIVALITDEDVFGLIPDRNDPFTINGDRRFGVECPPNPERDRSKRVTQNKRWKHDPNSERVKRFTLWLRERMRASKLTDDQVWERYAQAGFKRGVQRTLGDVARKRPGKAMVSPEFVAGREAGKIAAVLVNPASVDALKVLADRSFSDMKGVTEDVATRLSRTIADGLVGGKDVKGIARDVREQLKVSRGRAETIARTEIVRAHAEGQLAAMRAEGVDEAGVQVEWTAAHDGRVCPKCRELDGRKFDVSKASGLIPSHPNCRCAFVPTMPDWVTAIVLGRPKPKTKGKLVVKKVNPRQGTHFKAKVVKGARDMSSAGNHFKGRIVRGVRNSFCPTGKGGGVDPTCGKAKGVKGVWEEFKGSTGKARQALDAALWNAGIDTESEKPPKGKVDKRLLARRLASSWHEMHDDMSPEERASVERAMHHAGLVPSGGKAGSVVGFDGSVHEGIEGGGIFTGDKVMVKRQGWELPEIDGKVYRVLKAQVEKHVANAEPELIGLAVHANQELVGLNRFCSTGKGGGIDPSCGNDTHLPSGELEGDSPLPKAGKYGTGSGTRNDPLHCGSDLDMAVKALSEGKHVRLSQPDQVSTLIDKMHTSIQAAVKSGKVPPEFDLCKVTAHNTNLFCHDAFDLPRVKMPQLRGLPIPGTYAASLEPSKKTGKVDVTAEFIEHCKAHGVKVKDKEVRASHLRASQNQIVGSRVVQLVKEAEAGERDLREKPIFVTRDNYVVDGHHHWAAIVAEGAGKGKDLKMPVHVLDVDIGTALTMANNFARNVGIAPKSGQTNNEEELVGLNGFWSRPKPAASSPSGTTGGNCGTGAGGFQPGNTCGGKGAGAAAKEAVINSPQFKAWFGESKVVGKDGKPQETASVGGDDLKPTTVFHGTPHGEFHEFRKDKIANPDHLHYGPGFYFTEDVKAAHEFAKGASGQKGANSTVMEFYLRCKKPFDIDKDTIDPSKLPHVDRQAVRSGYVQQHLDESRSAAVEAGRRFDAGEVRMTYKELTGGMTSGGMGASKSGVAKHLQDLGHDGLTTVAADAPGGERGKNRYWIVFEPTSIKSTQAKNFDPHDPNTHNMATHLTSSDHELACVKLDVTDDAVLSEVRRIQASIDPADVVKLEDDPHVTLIYGLLDSPSLVAQVNAVMNLEPTVIAVLGGLSLFTGGEKGDVLKFDVKDPTGRLAALHDALSEIPNESTHPDYKPHVTVAYLRPGSGDKYLLSSPLYGTVLRFDRAVISEGKPSVEETTVNRDEDEELMIGLDPIVESALNMFCSTGKGGGIDPSCGKDSPARTTSLAAVTRRVNSEAVTAPPPAKPGAPLYSPNVEHKGDHGVTVASRVGVPADVVPPPPPIGRLPNLTHRERRIEDKFAKDYEKDPDGMAGKFLNMVHAKSQATGKPPTFGTDDAKDLNYAWSHPKLSQDKRSVNRATLNLALHQTANAICKRAFLKHLDTLKKGDEVLVTVGGCGAGKGFSLNNVDKTIEMQKRAKAVWDSAGDQNATENPWIQRECEKRGLKANYVFVHADPHVQWAHPDRGVVKRAQDPRDGRMVGAKVFADSYAIGARNHAAFHAAHKDNPNASFTFLSNGKEIPGIPKEALEIDRHALAKFAAEKALESEAPAHVKRGAINDLRVWTETH